MICNRIKGANLGSVDALAASCGSSIRERSGGRITSGWPVQLLSR